MRRVVVTGIGLVTPLGCGREVVWERLLAGRSGLGKIEHFETDDLACKIAGLVPRTDGRGGGREGDAGVFDPDSVMSARDRRRVDDFILYGIAAADEALADSGWEPQTEEDKHRAGVMIGSGIGGLETTYNASVDLHEKGPRRLSPFIIPAMLINLVSGQVSIRHGLKGPNHAVVTACSTGAHAIGDAARLVSRGDADVMVAGGAEATVCRLGIVGFIACKALSTGFNDTAEAASRPFWRCSKTRPNEVSSALSLCSSARAPNETSTPSTASRPWSTTGRGSSRTSRCSPRRPKTTPGRARQAWSPSTSPSTPARTRMPTCVDLRRWSMRASSSSKPSASIPALSLIHI